MPPTNRISLQSAARWAGVLAAFAITAVLHAQTVLQDRVDGAIRQAGLGATRLGWIVVDAETGATLGEHGADEALIPASNMKLFSSAAALGALGPDFVFETTLLLDRSAGSRLIVRGSGDPAFGDPALLEEMGLTADQLVGAWVTAWENAVAGPPSEIVIDDRVFDRELVHPTWPPEQLNRWYCAEVAGLNFYTNCIAIYLTPRGPGERPRIGLEPEAPGVRIDNRAKSVKSGQHTPWASRAKNTNRIGVHGAVRFQGEPVLVTVHDPALVFGRVLARRLEDRFGVKVQIPVRTASPEEALEGQPLHVVRTRLTTVLERCNTSSHNLYAECLLKRIAHETTELPGSWATGAAVVRSMVIDRVGPVGDRLTIADGSGMSRGNRLSARVVAGWLRSVHEDQRIAGAFKASLASPGEGTLRKWFRRGAPRAELRVKSGYLNGVTALSGYLTDPASGRTVIVSTIANDWPKGVRLADVRRAQEGIFLAADEWLQVQAAAALVEQGG